MPGDVHCVTPIECISIIATSAVLFAQEPVYFRSNSFGAIYNAFAA